MKIILSENQFKTLIKEEMTNFKTPEDVFNHIRTMPEKFKLSTKRGDMYKLYNDGISSAINNSVITVFYLEYLRNQKKTTTIMPIPHLKYIELYNKLNDIIKFGETLYVEIEEKDRSISLFDETPQEDLNMKIRLFKSFCFQLMTALLYKEYFNVDFRNRSVVDVVNNIEMPTDRNSYVKSYKNVTYKDGDASVGLFFGINDPVAMIIERYLSHKLY